MKKVKLPLLYSVALVVVAFVSPGTMAANLADAYAHAVQNDPVLGGAKAQFQARQQLIPQARAGLLPSITTGGTSSWNDREFPDHIPNTVSGVGTLKVPGEEFNEHGWQASVQQPVVNLTNWFTYRSARSSVDAAEASLEAVDQNLIVRVIQAYLNVLRAQDLLEATIAEEAAVKRQLEQVQQRFDVGLVAITDVLEAQAAYDNAVVRRVQAAGDHDIFFETLATLTGEPYESVDRLSITLPIVDPEPSNEEEWVTTALATNLAIIAAKAQLRAAERTVAARRSGHLPTITAGINHNHLATGGRSFLSGKTDQTTYQVGISLPIYQGGFTHSLTKEAVALAEQARQELQNQRLTVTRDTRNLFRSVATDVVRVSARLKAIASITSALEATQTGYEVGTRNIVDVLQAQQRLYSSQFDYADSRYNYVLDLMFLKQTTGTLIPEDLQELNQFMDPTDSVHRVTSLSQRSLDLGSQ